MSRPKAEKKFPKKRNATSIATKARARELADTSWGKTTGPSVTVLKTVLEGGKAKKIEETATVRAVRTHAAREGLTARFLREANGDPKAAESLRRAHYRALGQKGAAKRWKKKGQVV